MKKTRYHKKNTTNHLNDLEKSVQNISKNTEKMVEKIDTVAENTKDTKRPPKLSTIIEIIALIVTTIGVLIAYLQYRDSQVSPSEYKIYLSSEYTTLKAYATTDITATLNFDTNSINLNAYLNSIADGDPLLMTRNNETEWHKNVYFEHTGTYEVIATSIAPNGKTIEGTIEIKVIP